MTQRRMKAQRLARQGPACGGLVTGTLLSHGRYPGTVPALWHRTQVLNTPFISSTMISYSFAIDHV